MKTVLLLRHAKSDWSEPGQADFERPLAKRGLTDAPQIGKVLADFEFIPDKILSSPAQRARQTAELVAKACGYANKIEWVDSFYDGNSEALISALQQLPKNVERAMLVGHNPTMEETVSVLLTGQNTRGVESVIKMPTTAVVCLDFEIAEWVALEPGQAVLRWFLIPKLVQAMAA